MNDTAHHREPAAPAETSANPVLVEVTRGSLVESRHRAALAVVDPSGRVVLSVGEVAQPVYPRSAIKPLQALPLIETGAAEAFGLGDVEIALACASHNAEARHVEAVTAWLGRIGCTAEDLECGPQMPRREAAIRALFEAGGTVTAVHNNCSGKHTGFLSVARHLGQPTRGYIRYEHPVQQRILGVLESMTGLDLGAAPRGIDGCGIPVIAVPLGNLALAMARLADPHDQPEARQAACARIRAAMAAEPFMVAGSDRYCTRAIEATGGRALVKSGAEGVFCGALPELGLGFAVKVDDGAERAAEVLTSRILARFGLLAEDRVDLLTPPVVNRAGVSVGAVRCSDGCPV